MKRNLLFCGLMALAMMQTDESYAARPVQPVIVEANCTEYQLAVMTLIGNIANTDVISSCTKAEAEEKYSILTKPVPRLGKKKVTRYVERLYDTNMLY